jgi:hypothetical protein
MDDIIKKLDKMIIDTTAHVEGSVDISQGPYGSNILGMRYTKKKKKLPGGAEYIVHENKDKFMYDGYAKDLMRDAYRYDADSKNIKDKDIKKFAKEKKLDFKYLKDTYENIKNKYDPKKE